VKFGFLERAHLDFNALKELKDGSLHTASISSKVTLSFNANPLERIEGSLNSTAFLDYLSFIATRVDSIDPSFLYGFTGRIGELNFRDVPCLQETQFFNVNAVTAFNVRKSMKKCFDNFVPSEPTDPPEDPIIGELICKLNPSRKYYDCSTHAKLTIIDDL
jgi:hypothetical protein